MAETRRRALVIGIDGATFDLILPWVGEGKLPTFARLLREGSWGRLRSTIPPMSASAWSSFATGKNPGKHGVVDFHFRKEGSYELEFVSSRTRTRPALWDIAGEAGRQVGVINVPITYPPDEVAGFMISGLGAPGFTEKAVYPRELYQELKERVPGYILKVFIRDFIRKGRLGECVNLLHEQTERRQEAIKYLMAAKPWDLFIAVFTATDHAQHFFWRHLDPHHPLHRPADDAYAGVILDVYRRIDAKVGELMAGMDEECDLFILSDHGAGPTSDTGLYLDNWLHAEGLLHFREGGRGYKGLAKGLIGAAKRCLPRALRLRLKAMGEVKSKVESLYRDQLIDWGRTVAYADVKREAISVNLKGREPQGIVAPGDYERVREEIIARLKGFQDPVSGQPVFAEVYRREEIFQGPHTGRASDIICLQRRPYLHCVDYAGDAAFRHRQALRRYSAAELAGEPCVSAVHTLEGILIAWGKRIRPGGRVEGARIIDVAPTILYQMGLPVPEEMDGKVLSGLFREEFLAANRVTYSRGGRSGEGAQTSGYTSEEEEQLKRSLENLGYL